MREQKRRRDGAKGQHYLELGSQKCRLLQPEVIPGDHCPCRVPGLELCNIPLFPARGEDSFPVLHSRQTAWNLGTIPHTGPERTGQERRVR